MENSLSVLDLGIVILYFVIIILIGFLASRQARTSKDYLVAGQRLGYFLSFSTLVAVMLGGASTIGTTALGYEFGISGMWLVSMLGLGMALVGILLIKRIREEKILTISALLGKKFGKGTQTMSALVSAIYTMMVCATQIIAMGTIAQGILGWSHIWAMVIIGGIVILYTILGGMWAITWTDFFQFILLFIGVILVFFPMAVSAAGGFSGIKAAVPDEFFNITNIGWPTIIQYILLYALGAMVGQDIWQRFLTSKDVPTARASGITAGVVAVAYAICCTFIGMAALILLPNLDNPQLGFSVLAQEILPSGLLGLVIVSVLAVLMSTASGTLLASASLLTNDVVRPVARYLRERRGGSQRDIIEDDEDEKTLKASKRVTLVIGLVAMVIAIALNDVIAALDVSYAILSGALFVPIMAALFWKKATKNAALISIGVSSAVILVGLLVRGVTDTMPIIWGVVLSIILTVGISLYENSKKSKASA